MKIQKNDPIVAMLSAAAIGKTKDRDAMQKVTEFAADLMSDASPEKRYMMAELVRFAVESGLDERLGYLDSIADFKNLGDNDEALFEMDYDNAYAVIQADNATTPVWMPGSKSVTLNTVEAATRFRVSMYDLRSGKVDMAKLTGKAIARLEAAMASKILTILNASYNGTAIATPFYGTGSGVVATTLDPMIRYYRRFGPVSLVGDIAIMDKLAAAQSWVSDDMYNEYYQTGQLGRYKGAPAIQLVNDYAADGTTTIMPTNKLFIIPNGAVSPLKVVKKGALLSMDAQDAGAGFYEISLRQRFGAAVVYSTVPMLGVYNDAA